MMSNRPAKDDTLEATQSDDMFVDITSRCRSSAAHNLRRLEPCDNPRRSRLEQHYRRVKSRISALHADSRMRALPNVPCLPARPCSPWPARPISSVFTLRHCGVGPPARSSRADGTNSKVRPPPPRHAALHSLCPAVCQLTLPPLSDRRNHLCRCCCAYDCCASKARRRQIPLLYHSLHASTLTPYHLAWSGFAPRTIASLRSQVNVKVGRRSTRI